MAITLNGSTGIVEANLASTLDLSSKSVSLPSSSIVAGNLNIPGAIIKTQINRSSNGEVVVASTTASWFDYTFTTTRANSKILINFHSGQIKKPTLETNPQIFVRLNNNTNTFHQIDYNHQWYSVDSVSDGRVFLTGICLSVSSLAIATYTINVICGTYNGTCTFNHQYDSSVDTYQNRRPLFITQEIAA